MLPKDANTKKEASHVTQPLVIKEDYISSP